MKEASIPELERKHLDAAKDLAEARQQYDLVRRDADRGGRAHDDDPTVRAASNVLTASEEILVRAAREHLDALEVERARRREA